MIDVSRQILKLAFAVTISLALVGLMVYGAYLSLNGDQAATTNNLVLEAENEEYLDTDFAYPPSKKSLNEAFRDELKKSSVRAKILARTQRLSKNALVVVYTDAVGTDGFCIARKIKDDRREDLLVLIVCTDKAKCEYMQEFAKLNELPIEVSNGSLDDKTAKLDHLIQIKKRSLGIVVMDYAGAELAALQGGIASIKSNLPDLLVRIGGPNLNAFLFASPLRYEKIAEDEGRLALIHGN